MLNGAIGIHSSRALSRASFSSRSENVKKAVSSSVKVVEKEVEVIANKAKTAPKKQKGFLSRFWDWYAGGIDSDIYRIGND